MTPALEATGLHKRYRRRLLGRAGTDALSGVDLAVAPGTAFGLIGPNGAGKTTFIKCLLGIAWPDRGTVRLLGRSPQEPAVRARVGYLPERLHLPGAWRPPAFLRAVARLKGLAPGASELREMLARVGLLDVAERRIGGFSKGMRQRLALAAALLGRPELLVLDEPTDGVDPLGRMEVRRLLEAELARGTTLFVNSHLLSETERLCQRIGILSGGRLLREGPLEALCRAEAWWEVRFAPGAPAAALVAAGFRPAGEGTFRLDAEDAAAVNAALDRARAAGALLVGLARASRTLEDVLTDALRSRA
ncbi:MAG TPA: ABC transporter ATP-binding protein [Myxococcaceae bacterium]|jgi:ABC-2 type transport system ATP-binding protein|nr:ABC transporter ATP-binding protein [Myxococcaceae bacterium]